jgi:geranylgeranyl diphosphate synthase type I
MEAKEQLAIFKTELDKEFQKYLNQKIAEAKKISPYTAELIEHIADFSMRGGKRIRPALMYYSYLAHGGRDRKEALKVSMAIEMSETYLLIHDDIMDDDALRRGGMTIHESYRQIADEKYNHKSNPRSFGNSLGILAGDVACAMSNEIIANAKFKPGIIQKALAEFNNVYISECYGQTLDIISQLRDDVGENDVILTHQLKTVPYTFDGPVKIGAILAGASNEDLENLSRYSVPLGIAFQIQDDILGMFSSEEKLGKPITSDLREGKKTLLILDALKKANVSDKEIIELNLGNKRATIRGLKTVRKIVEETGALEKSKNMAEKLVNDAMEALQKLRLNKEGKKFLLNIADYMIARTY